jgi:CRISPR-associated protein Cas5t
LLADPALSTVIRTFWQIKKRTTPLGVDVNAGPDFQEILTGVDLVVLCDSGQERNPGERLEDRVRTALDHPAAIDRFGGWSLGESTHLVNDVWRLAEGRLPGACRMFVTSGQGRLTLPVWVDHVGFARTRYSVGDLVDLDVLPDASRLPRIEPLDE